jgi:hypothetical protein
LSACRHVWELHAGHDLRGRYLGNYFGIHQSKLAWTIDRYVPDTREQAS